MLTFYKDVRFTIRLGLSNIIALVTYIRDVIKISMVLEK